VKLSHENIWTIECELLHERILINLKHNYWDLNFQAQSITQLVTNWLITVGNIYYDHTPLI
jgi:hypothetical protein